MLKKKKIMILLGCVGMLTLVACGDRNGNEGANGETTPPTEASRPDETSDFEFSIDTIDDEDLDSLDGHKTINYGGRIGGLDLIFNFSEPITNFAFINVLFVNDTGDGDYGFVKTSELEYVGRVDDSLLLTNYWVRGSLPHLGFTFTTPTGEDVWYTFNQSQMDGSIDWRAFHWSHDYDLYDVDSNTQNNGEAVYHTVTAGETMFSISRMYSTTVDTIKALNNLTTYDITVDQVLRMPDGSVKDPSLATHNNQTGLGIDEAAALGIRVEWLRETFSDYVEFSYSEARGGERNISNETVLFAPAETLQGFAIIAIDPSPGEGLDPEVLDVLFYVGDLSPSQPLLMRDYLSQGTMPASGFTFIDEDGARRFFFFLKNQADGGPPFIVIEFEQTDFSFWDNAHMN